MQRYTLYAIISPINEVVYINRLFCWSFFKNDKLIEKYDNLFKEDNTYKEAFKKLNSFVERICDASLSDEEYRFICYKCDVDGVSEYLLKNMENQDIMELSKETDDWNYKLFLFSKFKA